MLDSQAIVSRLLDLGIPVSGSAISDAPEGAATARFYVFVPVRRDSGNRQVPSNSSLAEAKASLSIAGVEVDFVLTDGEKRDVEAGLRATLLHSFGTHIRNVFLSTAKQRATIWLDLKAGLEAGVLDGISLKSQVFLKEVGMSLGEISTTAADNLPTNTALLRVVRRLAPIDQSRLKEELARSDLTIPSNDWLSRRLDLLRKHGSLIRTHEGQYALSYSALKQLGTAKNSTSPDVRRLLALATTGK